jgi:hypothetical protein
LAVAPLIHQQPSPASLDHAGVRFRPAPADRASPIGARPVEGTAPEPGFGHDFGQVRVHAGGDAPLRQVTPGLLQRSIKVAGCEPPGAPAGSLDVTSQVAAVVANSVTAINKAVALLSESPLSPGATSALREFFGTSGPGRAGMVAANLQQIATQLGNETFTCLQPGTPQFNEECNPKGKDPAMAVAHKEGEAHPGIFLCGSRPIPLDLGASETIVHEGAHRAFNASDAGYYGSNCEPTPKTRNLGTEDLRWNADSYGCVVERLAIPPRFVGPLPPGE